MSVFGYVRASTDMQDETLVAQTSDLSLYAQLHKLPLSEIIVERGVSGSMPFSQRPEGGRLLRQVRRGDAIITTKLDRCFRSARDALNVVHDLQRTGVSLHMMDLNGDVTANGVSQFFFTIMSAVAEQERNRIRERITDVKRDQKRRGRFLGGYVPFGFDAVDTGETNAHGLSIKNLVQNPEQQRAIAEMRALKGAGKSLRAIAAVMAERGFRITHSGIRKVLGSQV
jgi:DNA invertase Pin-like site-specific DNA recombinase